METPPVGNRDAVTTPGEPPDPALRRDGPGEGIGPELALALEDVRKGRTHGPFDSADALMRSLRRGSKELKRAKKAC